MKTTNLIVGRVYSFLFLFFGGGGVCYIITCTFLSQRKIQFCLIVSLLFKGFHAECYECIK